jgi:hypothetical protein
LALVDVKAGASTAVDAVRPSFGISFVEEEHLLGRKLSIESCRELNDGKGLAIYTKILAVHWT